MPKAFPLPVNIGTDICSIPRILNIISRSNGKDAVRFINRVLREEEKIDYRERLQVLTSSSPSDGKLQGGQIRNEGEALNEGGISVKMGMDEMRNVAGFLAGRFAAKEAIIKAHHYRRLTFHDIAILKPQQTDKDIGTHGTGSRAPVAVVLPVNWKGAWDEAQEVRISISHDEDYAVASCIAVETC